MYTHLEVVAQMEVCVLLRKPMQCMMMILSPQRLELHVTPRCRRAWLESCCM